MAAPAYPIPRGEDSRLTVRVTATPDQTWALDAEYLHARMDVLKRLGSHYAGPALHQIDKKRRHYHPGPGCVIDQCRDGDHRLQWA